MSGITAGHGPIPDAHCCEMAEALQSWTWQLLRSWLSDPEGKRIAHEGRISRASSAWPPRGWVSSVKDLQTSPQPSCAVLRKAAAGCYNFCSSYQPNSHRGRV